MVQPCWNWCRKKFHKLWKIEIRTGILCCRLSNAARKCGSRGLRVRHDSSPNDKDGHWSRSSGLTVRLLKQMKLRGFTRSSTATTCGKITPWYKREDSEHFLFIYLFIYLFIPQAGTLFCGKYIRCVGRGGRRGRWPLREADFNCPHT